MSNTYFATRNAGASEWANSNGFANAEIVENFDHRIVEAGDVVIGTLPIFMIAEICKAGGEFFALAMKLPAELRGQSLSAAQMTECGATTTRLWAEEESVQFHGKVLVVTRHAGAVEWLGRKGVSAEVKSHFTDADMSLVDSDTTIVGILPPEMVVEVCRKGGNFIALNMSVPKEMFKTELSADIMEELGASLSGYYVAEYVG